MSPSTEETQSNVRRALAARAGSARRNHPSLKDTAADFVREGIVSGRFAPGAKVDQEEVAGTLGISRLPVREALIELGEKGFVTAIPRRGAFVVELTVEDVDDHFEVVGLVFALAARRAAKELDDAQLDELRGIHEEIAATEDPSVQEALNHEFYRVINRAGSSARLLRTLRFLSGALPNSYYASSPAWGVTEATYRERMLTALEAHDARAAAGVTEEHLRACAKLAVEELVSRGYWLPEGDGDAHA